MVSFVKKSFESETKVKTSSTYTFPLKLPCSFFLLSWPDRHRHQAVKVLWLQATYTDSTRNSRGFSAGCPAVHRMKGRRGGQAWEGGKPWQMEGSRCQRWWEGPDRVSLPKPEPGRCCGQVTNAGCAQEYERQGSKGGQEGELSRVLAGGRLTPWGHSGAQTQLQNYSTRQKDQAVEPAFTGKASSRGVAPFSQGMFSRKSLSWQHNSSIFQDIIREVRKEIGASNRHRELSSEWGQTSPQSCHSSLKMKHRSETAGKCKQRKHFQALFAVFIWMHPPNSIWFQTMSCLTKLPLAW